MTLQDWLKDQKELCDKNLAFVERGAFAASKSEVVRLAFEHTLKELSLCLRIIKEMDGVFKTYEESHYEDCARYDENVNYCNCNVYGSGEKVLEQIEIMINEGDK